MKTLNYSLIASFDVDAQKGFTPLCPNELPVPEGDQIVESLNLMATYASLRVASKDSHSPDALWVVQSHEEMGQPTGMANADLTWVEHCVPGTPGFELLDGLPAPKEYDFMVYKGIEPDMHPYGACYHDLGDTISTGVIEFLKSKGIDTVMVGGLALEFCVSTTAKQLISAGFKVVLFTPATRALNPDAVSGSISGMKAIGVLVANNEQELIKAING